MERLLFALNLFSALGCGLMAGLFFAFSVAVMAALGRLPPAGGVSAMQSINAVILNPWFLTLFLGTAAACLALMVAASLRWSQPGAAYLMLGGLLYIVGCIVVTMAFNVPHNDALAAVKPDSAEAANLWARYLPVWTAWNHVRTAACLAAAASFIMALR
jgi:uncharacterized membrane protein